MAHNYYVVYSAQLDGGACVGRTSVTRSAPITTFDDVVLVEVSVLEHCRKTQPRMKNLFLTYWAELALPSA